MMEEESWGVLTKRDFDHLLKQFTKRFGKPTNSKRVSFSFWDHSRNEIDTRIRITYGKAEIMQKVGNWEGTHIRSRSEHSINLQSDLKAMFGAYQILRVLMPGENACYIYQTDDFIFKRSTFEIKMTHQSGKTDKYLFEVEALGENVDLNQILRDLGLSEMVTITDEEFWTKWNEELNLRDNDLNEKQIKDLIQKYLNLT